MLQFFMKTEFTSEHHIFCFVRYKRYCSEDVNSEVRNHLFEASGDVWILLFETKYSGLNSVTHCVSKADIMA